MRSTFAIVWLVTLVVGCSKPQSTLAGGKPIAHWIATLHDDPDAKHRKEAAFKLGNVGPSTPEVFPALALALKDRDATVRSEAILALVKFGPQAQSAIPTLAELRDGDRDAKVRGYAVKALQKLQSDVPR